MLICCVDYVEDYLVVEEGGSVKENFVYNSMFSTFYLSECGFVLSNIIIPMYHIMFISNDELNGKSIL